MMPDYRRDNPYQSLLTAALGQAGIEVLFPAGYRRGFPIFRAVRDNAPINVLHLHWSEPYIQGNNWLSRAGFWWKLLVDLWLVRLSKVRVVWTLHNLLPHECPSPKLEAFFRRRLVRGMSQVIVHGRQSRVAAFSVLGCSPEKVTVVPHGNYRDVYPATTSEMRQQSRAGLPDDHRVFLFFGHMRPYKGIERLLQVWRTSRPQRASLWLIGPCLDAAYETQLRAEAATTPDARIECGFVEQEQVSRWFAGADVVVLPFGQVQTSGSVILALSFGKPVIAPRLGEIPESVGSADDLLYDPEAADGLATSLQRALTINLHELGCRSRDSADRLNWTSIAELTAAIYTKSTSDTQSI